MPLIPELGRHRRVCEFEASLAYIVSSRAAQRNPVPKKERRKEGKGRKRNREEEGEETRKGEILKITYSDKKI